MITEERAMSMFVEANPVPSRDDVALIPDGGAAYLATLEQRSSEVTNLEDRTEHPTPNRPKAMWLIAAVVALVVGVGIVIAVLDSNESPAVTEPTPTTVADAAPTTVAEPTPTTVVDAPRGTFEGEWDAGVTTIRFEGSEYVILQGGVGTDWGTWSSDEFTIMFQTSSDSEVCVEGATAIVDYSFEDGPNTLKLAVGEDDCADRGLGTTPNNDPQPPVSYSKLGTALTGDSAWDAIEVFISPESPSGVPAGEYRTTRFAAPFRFTLTEGWTSFIPQSVATIAFTTSESPEVDIIFAILEPSTVNETVSFFTSREELGTSEPVPASIGGAPGFTFEINPTEIVTVFSDAIGAVPDEPGLPRMQIYVVEVAGQPVTVAVRHPDESGGAFATQGQPLLDSIIWKDIS